jgi:hypothetical protein
MAGRLSAVVLADKTITSFDDTLASSTWTDASKQHGVFDFTNAEMNLAVEGSGSEFWIVFTAILSSGEERTLQAGNLMIYEDNNEAADPVPENTGTALTLEQGDARYINEEDGNSGDLISTNNLSDVADAPTALTNLGAEPAKGADDNFVTDAEKVVIGNTSNTNTGDQDLSTLASQTELDAKQNILTEGAFVDGDKTKLEGIEAGATANEPLLLATDPISLADASLTITGDLTSDGSTAVTFPVMAQVSSGRWQNGDDLADDEFFFLSYLSLTADWAYTGSILAGTAVFTPSGTSTGTPIPSLNTTLGEPGQRAIVDDGTNPVRHFYNAKIADGDADNWVMVASQTELDAKQNILTEGAFVDGDKTKLDQQSGTNTGDQDLSTLASQTDVDAKVSLTGDQTIAGEKTFTGQQELTGQQALTDDSTMTRGLLEAHTGNRYIVDDTLRTYYETVSTIGIDISTMLDGSITANLLEVEVIGGAGILGNTGRFWYKKYLIQYRRVNSATALETIEMESALGSFHQVSTNIPVISFTNNFNILRLNINDTAGGATTSFIHKITIKSLLIPPLTN